VGIRAGLLIKDLLRPFIIILIVLLRNSENYLFIINIVKREIRLEFININIFIIIITYYNRGGFSKGILKFNVYYSNSK